MICKQLDGVATVLGFLWRFDLGHVDLHDTNKAITVSGLIWLIKVDSFYTWQKTPAPCRNDQVSGRSLKMGQFCLYWCKGMSGTVALHIFCNSCKKCIQESCHKPSWGQIVKSQKNKCFIMPSCLKSSRNGIVTIDQMLLRHLFIANAIFNLTSWKHVREMNTPLHPTFI